MGSSRQSGNLFFYLFGRWPYDGGRWRGFDLFTRRFWRNRYIWHDTIGRHFNAWFLCSLRGHGYVRNANDPGEPVRLYCFACERDV